MNKRQLYINGTWVEPAVKNDHPVINPSKRSAPSSAMVLMPIPVQARDVSRRRRLSLQLEAVMIEMNGVPLAAGAFFVK